MALKKEKVMDMSSALGRIIKHSNGQFGFVELDTTTQERVLDRTLEINLDILYKCLKSVSKWYREHDLIGYSEYEVHFITALYESVCVRVGNVLALELAKQIRMVKENGSGEG